MSPSSARIAERNTLSVDEPQTAALKILVVDDNEPSALTLKWAIEAMGDHVEVCHDGRHALELVEQFQPDVLLLDLGMPGLNGLQVAKALRTDRRFASLKIIAQTGWGDSDMRRRTAAAGFDLHLVKPVDLAVLEDMLALLRQKTPAK